jgi:hypothetical protein
MHLWILWWNQISQLRPAFSRTRTFMWFAVCAAGMTIRVDLLGVTSIIRATGLHERFYSNLLDSFHSDAAKLDSLSALWTKIVVNVFPGILHFNDRLILVGDGIKIPKQGKKMPAVKSLHQESESNTKPEYIMGHSFQAVSILIQAASSVLAVPLAIRIHEGIVLSNRDKRTLLDKMVGLLNLLSIEPLFYFVADAYYCNGKMINGLLANGNHLVSRAKTNAVAYEQYTDDGKKKRGRPRLYGLKIKLITLFDQPADWEEAPSPVYGERNVTIRYKTIDLLWCPVGKVVRFVLVVHPTRGRCILMTTDLSLVGIDVIYLYGLRFKIEHAFKQAVRVIGGFSYHFWMKAMTPLRRRQGDQYLHREKEKYRRQIARKIKAYHLFVHVGIVSQGLLHYLAVCFPGLVWESFGSWLRTIRPGIAPSELVVATALRHSFPEFLRVNVKSNNLAKFIVDRINPDRMVLFRAAA